LPTTRNPDQADQPCIFHRPGIDAVMRIEKTTMTFSISENFFTAYCIHLPSTAYFYCPTSAKDLKRISAKV
jgi:hypothetical protein